MSAGEEVVCLGRLGDPLYGISTHLEPDHGWNITFGMLDMHVFPEPLGLCRTTALPSCNVSQILSSLQQRGLLLPPGYPRIDLLCYRRWGRWWSSYNCDGRLGSFMGRGGVYSSLGAESRCRAHEGGGRVCVKTSLSTGEGLHYYTGVCEG